jgi:hypothetical protein
MSRRVCLLVLVCTCTAGRCTRSLYAQDLAGIAVHGFVSQGFLFSSGNNYLSMKSTGWQSAVDGRSCEHL